MRKLKLQRIVPFVLISSMLLTSCGKKADCNLPTRHVHEYTKDINNEITINTYFDSEQVELHGYNWTENYMEITKTDEAFYKLLNSKKLFNGIDNWDYLYYEMANVHDYLKFYYEYETVETYTETDSKGNVTVHTRTVTHSGWTDNPNDSDNTGKTRLYHHKFYAYRINFINGEYVLERSPLVDDIREVLADYPYVCEKGFDEVYESFKFHRSELKYLSPSDFDTFNHPDLSNNTPHLEPVLTK